MNCQVNAFDTCDATGNNGLVKASVFLVLAYLWTRVSTPSRLLSNRTFNLQWQKLYSHVKKNNQTKNGWFPMICDSITHEKGKKGNSYRNKKHLGELQQITKSFRVLAKHCYLARVYLWWWCWWSGRSRGCRRTAWWRWWYWSPVGLSRPSGEEKGNVNRGMP